LHQLLVGSGFGRGDIGNDVFPAELGREGGKIDMVDLDCVRGQVPEEGIGVRLEDDVLITKTGHEVLSAGIPSAPDELEQLIQRLQA